MHPLTAFSPNPARTHPRQHERRPRRPCTSADWPASPAPTTAPCLCFETTNCAVHLVFPRVSGEGASSIPPSILQQFQTRQFPVGAPSGGFDTNDGVFARKAAQRTPVKLELKTLAATIILRTPFGARYRCAARYMWIERRHGGPPYPTWAKGHVPGACPRAPRPRQTPPCPSGCPRPNPARGIPNRACSCVPTEKSRSQMARIIRRDRESQLTWPPSSPDRLASWDPFRVPRSVSSSCPLGAKTSPGNVIDDDGDPAGVMARRSVCRQIVSGCDQCLHWPPSWRLSHRRKSPGQGSTAKPAVSLSAALLGDAGVVPLPRERRGVSELRHKQARGSMVRVCRQVGRRARCCRWVPLTPLLP